MLSYKLHCMNCSETTRKEVSNLSKRCFSATHAFLSTSRVFSVSKRELTLESLTLPRIDIQVECSLRNWETLTHTKSNTDTQWQDKRLSRGYIPFSCRRWRVSCLPPASSCRKDVSICLFSICVSYIKTTDYLSHNICNNNLHHIYLVAGKVSDLLLETICEQFFLPKDQANLYCLQIGLLPKQVDIQFDIFDGSIENRNGCLEGSKKKMENT